MQAYHYDETTKEYMYATKAVIDPLESKMQGEDVYLLPANATFVEPTQKDGYATIWNGDTWEHVEDNRGKEYWLTDDEYGTPAREMKELGALPDGAVLTAPEKPLEQVKSDKIATLKASRDAAEIEPIEWNGNLYDYDENARDRMKIKRQALEDNDPTATVVWTTADNFYAEIGLADFIAINTLAAERGERLHIKYNELKMQVFAAETADDVAAVVW